MTTEEDYENESVVEEMDLQDFGKAIIMTTGDIEIANAQGYRIRISKEDFQKLVAIVNGPLPCTYLGCLIHPSE